MTPPTVQELAERIVSVLQINADGIEFQDADEIEDAKYLIEQELTDFLQSREAQSPCGKPGHRMVDWVKGHFFQAMKPCDEPYDVYKCEICREQMHSHRDGVPSAWLVNDHCLACSRESVAEQKGFERGEEEMIERAYLTARGHESGDGFAKHGNRQLYWKGRSDAATEIRNLPIAQRGER